LSHLRLRLLTAVAALVVLAGAGNALAAGVVISQVYGGGGSASATATYNVDYVELYNNNAVAVSLTGWTLEYGSATGNWGSSASNIFTFPAGAVIEPCGYVLCQFGTASAGGAALPVVADFSQLTGLTMSATGGKVALFNAVNTNLACGLELPGTLVDKIAYGTTTNCAEGTLVGLLSVTTGAVRNGGGTIDTDNNLADFTIVSGPVPHNKLSTTGCPVPAEAQSWGALKANFR
jgi:uncharacterized protein